MRSQNSRSLRRHVARNLQLLLRATLPLAAIAALSCASLDSGFSSDAGSAPSSDVVDIAFSKFVLDNGLTLIVHEDHKAPIAAVNVWYHVGSKNEEPGRTGLAHLFEHLMFNGSENFNDDYFKALDRVGATDLNGTTNADRTNYFQNVPSSALDVVLWLESDRMGHLLGAVSQERLDEQRGVVQNEKRQRQNQPYGRVFETLGSMAYPPGHPYSWPTIGSMEDLDAASLDDVHNWFKQYYGATNAIVVVAGDVETEKVHAAAQRYFGDIPAGPALTRDAVWIAQREGTQRRILEDRVPQARIVKAWNIPEAGSADGDYLNLASDVLGLGTNSRLYKRLVYDEQIATDISAFVWLREVGGLLVVWATASQGHDLADVERLLDEEVQRFVDDGPTARELERVKSEYRAAFIRGSERIGGFGGKSDILARSEVFGGSPDAYQQSLIRTRDATPKQIRVAAQRWLRGGESIIEVKPFEPRQTITSDVDRSKLPIPSGWPEPSFPELARATLSNGLPVVLAERHDVPLVQFDLHVDAGYASDALATPGTAKLALDMLDEGTHSRGGLEISEQLSLLGATLGVSSNLDQSSIRLNALRENMVASLEIFADVVLNPAFAPEEFERAQKQQIAEIAREQSAPRKIGMRVFPPLLYGSEHAYGIPFSGTGSSGSVAELTPDLLRAFHTLWFRPDNATLVVVGDTTLDELVPQLEALLGSWEPGEVPAKPVGVVAKRGESRVFLIDLPGSLQSTVLAGHIAPPKANPDEVAIDAMNQVLGGSFSARLNMNLREDKHWSYGARSYFMDARGQRPFLAYAAVQTDKTKESMAEIDREIREIGTLRPPSPDEMARVVDQQTLTLPGRWETIDSIAGSVAEIVRFGFADDYWQRYPGAVHALELEQVSAIATEVIHPNELTWVIVGDRAKNEAGIRELNFGEVQVLDADGTPVLD
jgi:zinc protease